MGTKVKIRNSEKSKHRPCRPLDCIYDPDCVFSGSRDFQKCIAESFETQAEFGLRPLYATMFSDAYPRCMMVLKHLDRLPPLFHRTWVQHQRALTKNEKKPTDIDGVDRFRFFHRPVAASLQPAISNITFRTTATEDRSEQILEPAPRIQNRSTQTDYRESESQTAPWAPPVFTHCSSTPEVLTLANLSWGHGLPAGMHEVEIIERARIKRAWESVVPGSGDPKSIERMRNIIDTLERDEWLFREKEIQTIHNMRLDLARQRLQNSQHEEIQRLNVRLQHCWTAKQQEKDRKIEKIRLDHNSALRKLALRHKGISMKYREGSVVKKHTDSRSELYGPPMRFGEHPKRRHEVINVCSRFLTGIKGLETLETVPKLLQPSHHLTKPLAKDTHELCIHETRWTEAGLKQLRRDLKDTHMKTSRESASIGLISRLQKPIPVPETPCTESVPDPEREVYQGNNLQKMYTGQLNCQQLIEQMKNTTALQQEDLLHIEQEQQSIQSLEQEQLQNQREAMKVNPDTVDMQVEDLSFESMECIATAEVQDHVQRLAQRIDKAAEELSFRLNYLEEEELVADLIHNTVMPDVQKQLIHKHMKQRQAKYRQKAHALMYDQSESLPPVAHLVMHPVSADTNTKDKTATTKEQYSQTGGKETEQQQQEPPVVDNEVSAYKESERATKVTAILEGNFHKSDEGGQTS